MMVDCDGVETQALGFRQRLAAGGAAIDGDQKLDAFLGERADSVHVRAIAFEDAVRDVHDRIEAAVPQVAAEQCRRGSAIDVVIAEDCHLLFALYRVSQARGGLLHVGQRMRIGHQPLDARVEKGLRPVHFDAAAGQHPRQQFRNAVSLGNGERPRGASRVQPVAPSALRGRAFDAEKAALAFVQNRRRQRHRQITMRGTFCVRSESDAERTNRSA